MIVRLPALAATVAIALAATPPAVAVAPRQTGSVTFTSTKPGAPTGSRFEFEFRNPNDPNVKPYTVARFVVHYPAAGLVDTTVPPQCHATDAELQLEGAAACPANTKVGSGVAVSDTGAPAPFPRYSKTTIAQFNAQGEVIGVGQNQDIPVIRTVTRTKLSGSTASTDFPPFPGLPPPDPFTPLKSLNVEVPTYVRGGRTYARTPSTCPRVGYWTIVTDFTYHDGVTQSLVSHSPCQSRRHRRRHHKRHRHRRRHHVRFAG